MYKFGNMAALASALLAMLTFNGTIFSAAADDDTPTEIVSARDLDLTKRLDQDILQHRIQIAVQHVCEKPDIRNLVEMQSYDKCRINAFDSAFVQMQFAVAKAGSKDRYAATRVGVVIANAPP